MQLRGRVHTRSSIVGGAGVSEPSSVADEPEAVSSAGDPLSSTPTRDTAVPAALWVDELDGSDLPSVDNGGDQTYGTPTVEERVKRFLRRRDGGLDMPVVLDILVSVPELRQRFVDWSRGRGVEEMLGLVDEAAEGDSPAAEARLRWARKVVGEEVEREVEGMTGQAQRAGNEEEAATLRFGGSNASLKDFSGLSFHTFDLYRTHFPTLASLLRAGVGQAKDKGKVDRAIVTAISALLFARSERTNAFQWVVTFNLAARHAPASVYRILNLLGVSMSYNSMSGGVKKLSSEIVKAASKEMRRTSTVNGVCWDNLNITRRVFEGTSERQGEQWDLTAIFMSRYTVPAEEEEERA
ncbi:hypothetical protein JCM5296_007095, partial [Sporobolomyces johnsonii]